MARVTEKLAVTLCGAFVLSAFGVASAPERSLEDMVRDAWEWHQAHPDGY